jgi:hypothetical protein
MDRAEEAAKSVCEAVPDTRAEVTLQPDPNTPAMRGFVERKGVIWTEQRKQPSQ